MGPLLFRQLPILWKHRWLVPLAELARFAIPSFFKPYSKFVQFSKEIKLLASANKPVAALGGTV